MTLVNQSNQLNEIFNNLNTSFKNYSEFNPKQRVDDFYETCFSQAMLADSPIKNIAGNNSFFSMKLDIYLKEQNLTYRELIKSLGLSEEQTALLLEFEYDFSVIRPIGGPSKLSNKPINKSLIVMYSQVVLAICTAVGSIGAAAQPIVDVLIYIQEKEQKEIDQQIEIEKLKQNQKSLEQKDRELDLMEESLDLQKIKPTPPDNSINTI